MERAVEERFERIEALLRAMTERENQVEIRFNERMDRRERETDKAMRRVEHKHDLAVKRMDVFDRRLEATRKLVEAGMKIVVDLGRRQKALEKSHQDLAKSQKAFFDSLRRAGNGNGHRRG